jgi:hypothetical protein
VKATGGAGSQLPGGGSGGLGGAISSGLAGTVSAIAGVASAITGVIGVFQEARQEGTLNAIEANTRLSKIFLGADGGFGVSIGEAINRTMQHAEGVRVSVEPGGWMHMAWVSLLGTVEDIRDTLRAYTLQSMAPIISGAEMLASPSGFSGGVNFSATIPVYLDGRLIAEAHYQYLEDTGTRT